MRGRGRAGRPALPAAVARSVVARGDPFGAVSVAEGITNHVVQGVQSSYATAIRSYETYCRCYKFVAWPVDAMVVAAWFHNIIVTVGVQSLGMYLSGLQYHQELLGFEWKLSGNEVLRRTVRFLKREFPVKQQHPKLPVSVQVLRAILPLLRGWPIMNDMSENDRVFASASVHAVSAL